MHAEQHASGSYKIAADRAAAEREKRRLDALARQLDPGTRRILRSRGVAPGWRCLEVGGGSGSVARWLAERVVPGGSVLSTDVDLRFHGSSEGALTVRQHDITKDDLLKDHFDLAHARGVLQHIPAREAALDRMIEATSPGGWVVVEDADWITFEEQSVPEPFRRVTSEMMALHAAARGWDPRFGRRLLPLFESRGLEAVACEGAMWTMRGGTDSAEWYVLAVEYAGPILVTAGKVSQSELDAALAQARHPDFAIQSPLAVACWGRKPRQL
ncbi:MAG TPA: methyltransferase domain-containing protein [Myxococcota bacterium]|nr:methyltransferase domain-containing protein [Myxococcota bacterium]